MELRDIPGWPGYKASDEGRIYSYWGRGTDRGYRYDREPRRLAISYQISGRYQKVVLVSPDGTHTNHRVHRLVCLAFHGEPPSPVHQASHKDDDHDNNRPDNLLWETNQENQSRRVANGIDDAGHRNSRALLTEDQVVEMKQDIASGSLTHAAIGDKFGVSRLFVTKVANGYRYAR